MLRNRNRLLRKELLLLTGLDHMLDKGHHSVERLLVKLFDVTIINVGLHSTQPLYPFLRLLGILSPLLKGC